VTPDHHVLIVGTWRDDHYPGCACDVAAPVCFTFQYRAATAKFDRHNYDVAPATEHSSEPEKVAA